LRSLEEFGNLYGNLKIRNSKHEIRNKPEISKFESIKQEKYVRERGVRHGGFSPIRILEIG